MSGWGISEKASEKEKIKAEYADFLNGLNSTGRIDYGIYSEAFDIGMDLMDIVYEQGKVDAVPVVHAHWEFPIFADEDSELDPRCRCSECGSVETPLARHRYCPNCGALMEVEKE